MITAVALGHRDHAARDSTTCRWSAWSSSPPGILVFRIEVPSSEGLTLVGSVLTGIGLGATVAPALFVAGFALRATNLQRVFAIVELLRAVAAFMIAPIFAHFAVNASGGLDHGVGIALWIGFALAILGGAVAGRPLRARRRPARNAGPRGLPRRRGPGLLLAAAARPPA